MKNKQKQQNKEYRAYKGEHYIIEWYFDSKGKSISLDYLETLEDSEQVKLYEARVSRGDYYE